jgi:hypothetical protein
MHIEPRAVVPAESYPTFWNEVPTILTVPVVLPEDAYVAFINLAEEDLPIFYPKETVQDAD